MKSSWREGLKSFGKPMEARLYGLGDIFLVGCETKLGIYLSRNAGISMTFWKRLNKRLKMRHVKQGKQFVKYALTWHGSQGLTYACAVPSAQLYPDRFQIYRIPKGEYLCMEHHDDMAKLPGIIGRIFKQELKGRQLTSAKGALVYSERRDERFHYCRDASVIEPYIPPTGDTYKSMEEIKAKTIL